MHPLRIGALYGLIAAVLASATYELNHHVTNKNIWIGLIGGFLLPIVAVYLSGHYAGRHERYKLSTAVTGGLRSTLHGTGAGIVAGLVFLILTELSPLLNKFLPTDFSNVGALVGGGALGATANVITFVLAFIGWLFGGLLLGTVGGAFGDNQAHKELKSGKVPTGTTASA